MKKLLWTLSFITSGILAYLSWQKLIPMDITEVLGFITGGYCVWLTVKENIWNWPIGIANSVFFLYLFGGKHLFADAGLQVIYIVLGLLGWYWWLKGGKNKTKLSVTHIGKFEALLLLGITVLATYGFTLFLRSVHDAAPFLDALTTIMSLVAQYMLTKKLFENWYVWMTADMIYIGLYIFKGLYLTSILYGIFFIMCAIGLKEWLGSMKQTDLLDIHSGGAENA